jgi:hypothetical protein
MPIARLFTLVAAAFLTIATAAAQSLALDGSRDGTIAELSGAELPGANFSGTSEGSSAPCLSTAAGWFSKELF